MFMSHSLLSLGAYLLSEVLYKLESINASKTLGFMKESYSALSQFFFVSHNPS